MRIFEIWLSLNKQALLLLGALLPLSLYFAVIPALSKENHQTNLLRRSNRFSFLAQSAEAEKSSENPAAESSAEMEKPASADTDWINKSLDTSDPENPFAENKNDPFGKTGDFGSKADLSGPGTSTGSSSQSKPTPSSGTFTAFNWPVPLSACSQKESDKEKEKEKEKNLAAGKSDEPEKPWLTKYKEGKSLFEQGNYDQSEEVFRQAIKLADEDKAVEPGVVDCFVALSMVKDKQGDVAESERLYEFAMRGIEGVRSSTHPRYGDYLPNLALLYFSHGKNDLARYSLDRLLNIRFSNPGENKEDLASAYEVFSRFLSAVGDPMESEIYSKKAQTLRYGH